MKSPTYLLKLSLIIAPVSYFSDLVQSVSQYNQNQLLQSKQSTVLAQYAKYTVFPSVIILLMQLSDALFSCLSKVVITVIIEAFYLGKLVTEKKRICPIQYFVTELFI